MEINNKLKKKINNSVVRITAEKININWNIPYFLEEPNKGQGTGFFIDKVGHILTCAHVVSGARNIYIEIPNLGSKKIDCELIGFCPYFDIALLKTIKYKPSDYLSLGDSDKLNIQMKVQVVGFPTSYTKSGSGINNIKYTSGIISGQQDGFIQTDSSINPGNSGGPLFCNNKVIGINSMKMVGGSLDNIGYSIPINNYIIIKDDLKKNKIVYRPNLLYEFNNTDKNLVKEITNGKTDSGIMISNIYDLSILKKTNIKKGSIITQIDCYKIDNYGLTDYKWIGANVNIDILLNKFKNGNNIKIKYYNGSKLETSLIKIEPFIPPIRKLYPVFEKVDYFILGGIIFMNLSLNQLGDKDNTNLKLACNIIYKDEVLKNKLYITYIFPNTKVNILNNISSNDIITKVNDKNVCCLDDLKKALKSPIIINKKEYIKIENNEEKSVIMSIMEFIEQDILFSQIYKYPLNEFHEKYLKK
jgi:S1-C subfamily serine protease